MINEITAILTVEFIVIIILYFLYQKKISGKKSLAGPSHLKSNIEKDFPPILQEWHKKARVSQYSHYKSYDLYYNKNVTLGCILVLFSSIVGASVFVNLLGSDELWVKIFAGIFSVLATIISGLYAFLNYSEIADNHKEAGAEYGSLKHDIEEKAIGINDNWYKMSEVLPEIRKHWDVLIKNSPAVQSSLWKQMHYDLYPENEKPK